MIGKLLKFPVNRGELEMIIAVKYLKDGALSSKEYNYDCKVEVSLDEIIDVPVRNHNVEAIVTKINVAAEDLGFDMALLKTIYTPKTPVFLTTPVFRTEDEINE